MRSSRPGRETISAHLLIGERAAAQPDAAAVVFRAGRLSYRDLDRRANRLAGRLQARGVGPDQVVGVHLARGTDLVVASLGVLKAGAAYLPLDPANPPARLHRIVAGAGVRIVVCRTDRPSPPSLAGLDRIDVDATGAEAGRPGNPDGRVSPRNLAYVMATSGSTGVPKGVMVEHGSLTHLIRWMIEASALRASDRVSMVFAPGFDATVVEIWPALAAGACLCVLEPEDLASPRRLQAGLLAYGVTVALLPVSLAEPLLALVWPQGSSPRIMHVGGDRLRVRPSTRLPFALVNQYGPTENTVATTAGVVDPAAGDPLAPPAIGRPIAGKDVWVLDDSMRPAAAGATGELYVGGAGLARGYAGLSGETAERFLPHPLSASRGERLYRTGDLGRRLPGGNVEFRGRADEQIKLFGHRIEPGEVEVALASHSLIATAHVRADAGHSHLVAFVVPADSRRVPGLRDLDEHVRQRLPEAMLPGRYVVVEALPLTGRGKVDRRALARYVADGGLGERTVVAGEGTPRTDVEERLTRIWRELFSTDRIDAASDFGALGGHSLLATRLAARIRRSFGVDLATRDVLANPTVAQLAERIEEARDGPDRRMRRAVDAIPGDGPLAPSFQQEQVWLLDRLTSGAANAPYQSQLTVRIVGLLDLDRLERALNEITRRHDVLRTTYEEGWDGLVPVVHPHQPVRIARADLRDVPAEEVEARAERIVRRELSRRLSLSRLPLARWKAIRLGTLEHQLVLVQHHAVHDGWSDFVLLRELEALYNADAAGAPSPLGDLPIQYQDYARRQRREMESDRMRGQLAFWRERLADLPDELRLPANGPRQPIQTFAGDLLRAELPALLPSELRRFCADAGVTPFAALFATFVALLHRYTRQRDICVGSAFANRAEADTEDLLGMFVNMVVLRCPVDDDSSFRALAARAHGVVQDALANQEFPFSQLVQALGAERDPARNPLVQVVFSCHDAGVPSLRLADASGTVSVRGNGAAKFDLTVTVVPRDQRLRGEHEYTDDRTTVLWEYNTTLFGRDAMRRMLDHYVRMLSAAVSSPDLPLSRLHLLGDDEREWLLHASTGRRRGRRPGLLVHQLVARQAGTTPAAPAVASGEGSLTYAELGARVNQLAAYLRGLGIGPDAVVCIFLERGLDLVVAILAVLTADAAYLPLDPDDPPGRRAQILADAEIQLVLTSASQLAELPAGVARLVALDRLELRSQSADPVVARARPENLAYVMYTSGSTGRPKGVAVPHHGLVNRILAMQDAYGLGPDDRLLHKTSIAFDPSVWEILWPLSAGAELVVAPPGAHRDPGGLADLVAGERITTVGFVPSVLRLFLERPDLERCASLRRILCGGEELPAGLRDRCLDRLDAELHNLYGPTEATIEATTWHCQPGEPASMVPIGRPIDNVETYVLDAAMRLVSVGVAGELCVGGAGLARGYVGRPDLTAERFVPDPFSGRPGARLLHTGDAARWRSDGAIEFLGRLDDQVKIRGQRVEPSEVAAALMAHPGVAAAHVSRARAPGTGDARLVAHVVPRVQPGPAPEELRAFLGRRLSAAMVPSAYVTLPALPLTGSGKVDRRALPAYDAPRGRGDRRRPASELERGLVRIWQQVLGVDEVGVEDNFFDVGGDSLLAAQVSGRMARELGVDVLLVALFEHPTIHSLVTRLSAGPGGDDGRCATHGEERRGGRTRLRRSARLRRGRDEAR